MPFIIGYKILTCTIAISICTRLKAHLPWPPPPLRPSSALVCLARSLWNHVILLKCLIGGLHQLISSCSLLRASEPVKALKLRPGCWSRDPTLKQAKSCDKRPVIVTCDWFCFIFDAFWYGFQDSNLDPPSYSFDSPGLGIVLHAAVAGRGLAAAEILFARALMSCMRNSFAEFHSLYTWALIVGWTGFKLSRFWADRGGLFCNIAVSHSSPDALHDVGVSWNLNCDSIITIHIILSGIGGSGPPGLPVKHSYTYTRDHWHCRSSVTRKKQKTCIQPFRNETIQQYTTARIN